MRSYKLEAVILKRQNIGEADRILTIFSKKYGKIRIKAIGVRKITSRRSSHVEPINHVILSLYKGRGMPILTEVQTIENFSDIKQHLGKVGFAYHLCELIDTLCPEDQENAGIFPLFLETLTKLSHEVDMFTPIIYDFEISLLSYLGFYEQPNRASVIDTTAFIERILERKLKTKEILHRLL